MNLFRTIAERLARGKVVWRRLPNGVRIAVSPDAQLKYLAARFDHDLVELARDRVEPGAVVWDIGANCGTFAFSCNRAVRVLAVEPDPFLAGLLRQSARSSGAPVEVVEAAISDRVGTAELCLAARGRASNHLSMVQGSTQTGGERARIPVQTLTLDALFETHGAPDFVKIDIEGAEVAALNGASRMLDEARPTIYLEVYKEIEAPIREIFDRAGYAITEIGPNWLAVANR